VSRLREQWPTTTRIEIRADAGFALPAIYSVCHSS
jgi:hypothetical protein